MNGPITGGELAQRRIAPVSAEAMKTMAVILADPNPIHLDPEVVRELGMGDRVINQGPTGCGYVMDMLSDNFPTGRVRSLSVRFIANVLGGDDVTVGGTVENVTATAQGDLVECAVWLDIVDRGRALAGTATVVIG